jgi:hypothetical protein
MSEDKLTLTQELQSELYGLFQQHIFNLEGVKLQQGDNPPEMFVAKSLIVEACIKVLNNFGESLSQDERLIDNESNT